ncbi:MAG: hypothetical protein JNJ57_05890 [Saprospiraceae bacterium]|nr:hypothetical protein [Saprospiraceae bacterium]
MKFRFPAAFAFIFLFFGSVTLWSQATPRFPEDPTEFVNKLGEFMTYTKRPDMEESFSVFKRMHKAGAFPEAETKQIIAVANMLGAQNLSAFPYYKNYINAIIAAKNDPDTTLFRRWHGFAETVIAGVEKGRAKPIGQFLEFSVDMMETRALKTGEGGSVTWKVKGGKFEFLYQDKVPRLVCEDIDLIGARKLDSMTIKKTSGAYFPFENQWKGLGGKVSWAEAGMDSSIYAELTKYIIDTNKPLFTCDTATLYYPLYFNKEGIKGRFEHNVVVRSRAATAKADSLSDFAFPKFESFDKILRVNKIGEGIEYVGGFKLAGNSLYGYGTRAEPAQMTVYNKKRQRVFFGKGPLFIIKRGSSVVAQGVDAKLYMDTDSLFHPAANFRIDIPKQVIALARGEKGSERNPFFSSFYNMNLNTDRIAWHLNQDSLEIGVNIGVKGTKNTVSFESSNFYDANRYNSMQGIASHNPISTLYNVWQKTDQDKEDNGRIVTDNAYAFEINPKFDYSSIQTLLAQMVEEGYINYYFDRHEIELRDKLIHYALASQGKRDFDAINIVSESSSANAKLNLQTKETEIFEVRKLDLSKRQKVAVLPGANQLTLLKNRDMRFGGRLYAGLALFQGNDMYFNYEKFQVEFDSVRHLDFYIPTGEFDKNNQPIANAMNSHIEHVSGALLVDAPNNKSGKEDMQIFPSLQSKKFSFVFYDRKDIQEGAYTRDSFYFRLDPFSFNGLDSYTKEQLKFRGELFPATIFPNFKETIVVREEDKSFGFIHKTPPTGYPTYTKKGLYTGALDLSNKGLRGKGVLKYLTADIESEDLVFKPKQTTGTAKKFFMTEDRKSAVKVPQAQGENVSVNWLPFKDSMYIQSKAKAFELFKEPGYSHKGVLILTPTGLKGRGEFEWAEGKLTSKIISYGPFQASADTGNIEIKSLDGKGIAFDSKNVDGELDFDAKTGHFKANTPDANTSLPYDQYRTSMNEFTWDMRKQTIEFKADPNKPGIFVSTDKGQDSLKFEGKTALYDLKTNLLQIGGVKVIQSSDAYIYPPDTSDVYIQPGGKMRQIQDARIEADTASKYHTITRAKVDILGKNTYTATGYYQYNIPGYKQEIFFNNIKGDLQTDKDYKRTIMTTAAGDIPEKDSFRLDVKTFFKGKMILEASKQNMRFEGYAKLDADKLPVRQWFTHYSVVDKNDPVIRIKNTKDPDENPMVAGFYISRDNGEAYPRVLLPAYQRVDRPLLDCKDVYKYDPKTDRFIFGDSLRVIGKAEKGAKMIFDNRVGTIQGEGPLTIGSGLEYMKLKAAGRLKSDYNGVTDSTFFEVTGEIMTAVELPIPKILLDLMINDIKAASFDQPAAVYNTNVAYYQPLLREFVSDEKDMEEMIANLRINAILLPKKDDNFTFVFGRQAVRWNTEYSAFITLEDKFPLVSVAGQPINKNLTMYISYKMPGSGEDKFSVYLKASPDLWYFFSYQPNPEGGADLNLVSSSTKFNDLALSLKAKDTKIKMPDGKFVEVALVNASSAESLVNFVRSGRAKE